jgi:hypothetical protein
VDLILWECKEHKEERQSANIQNNISDKGKDGMKQLIKYAKRLGFYCLPRDNMKEQNKNAI